MLDSFVQCGHGLQEFFGVLVELLDPLGGQDFAQDIETGIFDGEAVLECSGNFGSQELLDTVVPQRNVYDLTKAVHGAYEIAFVILVPLVEFALGKHSGRYFYDVVQWKDYAQDPLIGYVQERQTHGHEKHMERLKAALDYLVAGAHERAMSHNEALLVQFKAEAKAWREAAVKPAMPESAREHQVLAEFAFKEKNVDKAIVEYTAALEIFPTWPEGQFNLATLAGEKKLYGAAIFHMKQYLELVPESADAQAARDSIIVWKHKLNAYFPANDASRPHLKNVSEEH